MNNLEKTAKRLLVNSMIIADNNILIKTKWIEYKYLTDTEKVIIGPEENYNLLKEYLLFDIK